MGKPMQAVFAKSCAVAATLTGAYNQERHRGRFRNVAKVWKLL
jgi:hypothetical protein